MRWCLTAPVATTDVATRRWKVHTSDAFAELVEPARHVAVRGRPARDAFVDIAAVLEPLALRAPRVANG